MPAPRTPHANSPRILLPLALAPWLLLLALGPEVACAGAAPRPPPPRLRFRRDGTFSIAQITDLHYSGNPEVDALSDQVQRAVLEAEQPDLAVFSGDQVSGFAWKHNRSAGWYEDSWRQLIRPVHDAGVPYASILGNHDGEADLSRQQIVELDAATGGELSLTQMGPSYLPGHSNYWLDVYSSDGKKVAARIWLLDSGNRGCDGSLDGWGCVPASVVAWVEERAAQLPPVPSLAFVHIPLPQFMELWNEHPTVGKKGKRVACPLVDTGAFEAFKRAGILAVYSGHDHPSDFMGELRGVRLAYGRKTGHGARGPRGAKGARIIQLRLGQSAALSATWIRTGDGQQEEQMSGPPTQPGAKQRQEGCSADPWLLQRLRSRAYVLFWLTQLGVALATIAATAGTTVAVMRWRQRGQRSRRQAAKASKGGTGGVLAAGGDEEALLLKVSTEFSTGVRREFTSNKHEL